MLLDGEPISARSVVRRSGGLLRHASDVTRNADRRTLVDDYKRRQAQLKAAMARVGRTSRDDLAALLAEKDARIRELEAERELLIGASRAAIRAASEMGGASAWRRFYEGWESGLRRLGAAGVVPAELIILDPGKRDP